MSPAAIAPMLNLPIEITARDPQTSGEIWARLDPGEGAWWEPRTTVVLDGIVGKAGPSFRSCCAAINFFELGESALQYLIANPEVGGRPISPRGDRTRPQHLRRPLPGQGGVSANSKSERPDVNRGAAYACSDRS